MRNSKLKIFILSVLWSISAVVLASKIEYQDYWSYQLQPGEILAEVCEDQVAMPVATCLANIAKFNHLKSTNPKVGTRFKIPVSWLREDKAGVRLLRVFGEAYYQDKTTQDWSELKDKKFFFAEDRLLTKKGNAVLKFHDGSEVVVHPNTEITFSILEVGGKNTGKIQLFLSKGSIDNHIQKRQQDVFKIETVAGVAAVRGTNFRVRLTDDNSMFNEVLGGEVAVSVDNQSAAVEAGFGVKATQNVGLSQKKQLLEAPVILSDNAASNKIRIVRVEWQPLEHAVRYQYELYRGEELLLKETTPEEKVALSIFRPDHYHVLVRGIDDQGYEGKNARVSFVLEQ